MNAAGRVMLSAVRKHPKRGTSPEFPGHGSDAQCRDRNHCAGFAVQCCPFSRPFDRRRADTLRADAGRQIALRVLVSCSFKPLYPRHLLIPHGRGTINIAKRYRAAIRCMVVVKQRIMPRAANRYYASSWVIGAHPTDMLTGRGANLCGTHPFCNSRDNHGWLDDLRAASRDSCAEMYEIRIERRLVTAYGQAPIVQALVS